MVDCMEDKRMGPGASHGKKAEAAFEAKPNDFFQTRGATWRDAGHAIERKCDMIVNACRKKEKRPGKDEAEWMR